MMSQKRLAFSSSFSAINSQGGHEVLPQRFGQGAWMAVGITSLLDCPMLT